MDFAFIVPLLALVTLLAVCILGLKGKWDTEARKHDPSVPKSSLAADAPDHRKAP